MANPLQQAGAMSEPTSFAPLHSDRIFTGYWSNRSPLRDAATSSYMVRYGMGRQDSMIDGVNVEISSRLTLIRRPGFRVYNNKTFPPVLRYYAFNTFTTSSEDVRVMVDTATKVYDGTSSPSSPNTQNAIWTKAAGADKTNFLGVGNTLYMTNGKENVQWIYPSASATGWGTTGPANAPSFTLDPYAYGSWVANTVFSRMNSALTVTIVDPNGYVQSATNYPGNTGVGSSITWNTTPFQTTSDGAILWENIGNGQWAANHSYQGGDYIYNQATDGQTYFYEANGNGTSGPTKPQFLPGIGSTTTDNTANWVNRGRIMHRPDVGDNTFINGIQKILDPTGNPQICLQTGQTGATLPTFQTATGALTYDPTGNNDGMVIWKNSGAVGEVQYGYAYQNSTTKDLTNMSPPSATIATSDGENINVYGAGTTAAGMDKVVIYRTMHGGSTFFYLDTIDNPAGGGQWNYTDTKTDAELNNLIQAQAAGQGSPLPVGASCMEYHCNRVWAAVGNVIYHSTGPEAALYGGSNNSGFDPTQTFTVQSKVMRMWASVQGLIVYTVRDAYIITGSGVVTEQVSDPFVIQVYIAALPLLSYDAFCVHLTTPYLYTGYRMVLGNDPGAGIVDVSFPIEDKLALTTFNNNPGFDPATSYLTFHHQQSGETAMYLSNGNGQWFRMSATAAPEQGSNWTPYCSYAANGSAMQSVEIQPGIFGLLLGSGGSGGPLLIRDVTTRTDNGAPYAAFGTFGSITMAEPGQLAALAYITLESTAAGSSPALSVLLGETEGTFEKVPRTRQDPPNLIPSKTVRADRHSLLQGQSPVWCRHFQFRVDWPAEDAANELLTFTIFGQTWQEMRSQ